MNTEYDSNLARPSSTIDFEETLQGGRRKHYVLLLYIAGMTPRSRSSIENIKQICEEHLKGVYTLEVIDIYQQPERAKEAQILAAPTLIKRLPLPLRKLIGDMSNKERVFIGLDLQVKE
jgi:circadian clock protein KaiB